MSLANGLKSIVDDEKTHLNLYVKHIRKDDAMALATALQRNTTLTRLDLTLNSLGDEGATALATALQGNTTLRYLYLCDNFIGKDGAMALSTALDGNTTLIRFSLWGNNLCGERTSREIDRKVQLNVILYRNMFWQPAWHSDFPPGMHDLFVTTLLCNNEVGGKKLPRLPLVVWQQVFSFYCRKAFL